MAESEKDTKFPEEPMALELSSGVTGKKNAIMVKSHNQPPPPKQKPKVKQPNKKQ